MKEEYIINKRSKVGFYVGVASMCMFLIYFLFILLNYSAGNNAFQIIYSFFLVGCNFIGLALFGFVFCKEKPSAIIFCLIPNLICDIREVIKKIVFLKDIVAKYEDNDIGFKEHYTMYSSIISVFCMIVLFILFILLVCYIQYNRKLWIAAFAVIASIVLTEMTIYNVIMLFEGAFLFANFISYMTRVVQITCMMVLLFKLEKKENKVFANIIASEVDNKKIAAIRENSKDDEKNNKIENKEDINQDSKKDENNDE